MTNKEILEKAIQKAKTNGWEYPFRSNTYEINKYVKARPEVIAFGTKEDWQDGQHLEGHWSIPELIFNHQFAKALWGEVTHTDKLWIKLDNPTPEGREYLLNVMPAYEYHLKQMVVSSDPIKYLGEHLDGK